MGKSKCERTIYEINVGGQQKPLCGPACKKSCCNRQPSTVVYVSHDWGCERDPFKQFCSIQSAVDFINNVFPNRTINSQVTIYIYPGVYGESVILAHNISLCALGAQASVTIAQVSFVANSSITFGNEIALKDIACTNMTFDSSNYGAGGFSRIFLENVWSDVTSTGLPNLAIIGGEVIITSSNLNQTQTTQQVISQNGGTVKVFSSSIGGPNQITGGTISFYACEIGGPSGVTSAITGNGSKIACMGSLVYGLQATNATTVIASGTKFQTKDVTIDGTSQLIAPNSTFATDPLGTGVKDIIMEPFTVAMGGSASVNVTGQFNFSSLPYGISWIQTAGTSGTPVFTAITPTSFTITAPTDASYQITVSKINNASSFP